MIVGCVGVWNADVVREEVRARRVNDNGWLVIVAFLACVEVEREGIFGFSLLLYISDGDH